MERRVLWAVILMGIVITLTNVLFPPAKPKPAGEGAPPAAAVASSPAATGAPLAAGVAQAPAREVTVTSPLYRYTFSTRGAALARAEMLHYASAFDRGQPVQLVPAGVTDFLAYRLVTGRDTVDLRGLPFQPSAPALQVGGAPAELRFTYGAPGGLGVEVTYTFHPDNYLVDVRGRVTGAARGAQLLTDLGPGLANHEAEPARYRRDQAAVAMSADGAENLPFMKVEGADTVQGPLTWAATKNKYFVTALVAGSGPGFGSMVVRQLPEARLVERRGEKTDTVRLRQARTLVSVPLGADGSFAYQEYVGPQEHGRLAAVGHDLDQVNPYGYRWLRPVVRPIAAGVLWILRELHDSLGLSYGWVLVIFGVMMKVILWPLNSKAMRAQLKNMAVQPLMQEIQTKYKNDPQKQQEEMMKLYREYGFNPVAGCLPLLIPMPVLFTLFFVFQSAIEFRGVGFGWLPDLSQRDPLYILPVLLMGSTFLMQWISTKLSGMEQNAQMKTMMYFMPLMMGMFFFNLASGLNLYYLTTNLAGIPQQLLISRERKRHQDEMKKQGGPVPVAKKPGGSGGSGGQTAARRVKRRG
ncbi:MAG: membrane protein insertase YidC [Gemmatimonadetes bacterium]|nr:membrane protein insertase YidC [Gemmatimonadota bacterium]